MIDESGLKSSEVSEKILRGLENDEGQSVKSDVVLRTRLGKRSMIATHLQALTVI